MEARLVVARVVVPEVACVLGVLVSVWGVDGHSVGVICPRLVVTGPVETVPVAIVTPVWGLTVDVRVLNGASVEGSEVLRVLNLFEVVGMVRVDKTDVDPLGLVVGVEAGGAVAVEVPAVTKVLVGLVAAVELVDLLVGCEEGICVAVVSSLVVCGVVVAEPTLVVAVPCVVVCGVAVPTLVLPVSCVVLLDVVIPVPTEVVCGVVTAVLGVVVTVACVVLTVCCVVV